MTSPRLRRLQSDSSALREAFSSHPDVDIQPRAGADPPECYEVTLRVRGLRREGDRPSYADTHRVDIHLPLAYPGEPPYCIPITPVFHPNVQDYFCIADHWSASTTLSEIIVKLGEMIQWRDYNVDSPLDPEAAQWAKDHASSDFLPVGDVDLYPSQAKRATDNRNSKQGQRIELKPDEDKVDSDTDDAVVVVRST